MTQEVGYQIFDKDDNLVGSIGGIMGQMPGFPNPLILPNGDQVAGATGPATFGDYTVRVWVVDDPLPTSNEINAERDRRIESGLVFNDKVYDSGAADQTNITDAAQMAVAAISSGAQAGNLRWQNPTKDFSWIAQNNTIVTMDAQTVVALSNALITWKQNHVFAARAIKDTTPIPLDFRDDKWWPAGAVDPSLPVKRVRTLPST